MRAQTTGPNAQQIDANVDQNLDVHHVVAVYNSDTDRQLFINGELRGTETTGSVPGNLFDRTTIGRWDDSTPAQNSEAVIYLAGTFHRAFSEAEAKALSADLFRELLKPATPPVYFVPSAAAVTGALTGTTVPTITETDIVDGGKTSIITLTGDTWVASGATFDAQRQAIINGFDAASSPTNGWNNEVQANEVVTAVVRTSDTVVTVTWTAAASYDISSTETITCTIPNAALVTSGSDIIVTPTFTVTAVAVGLPIPVAMFNYRRRR